MPISLVSDSTTPRGGKRGPSTLCVPRNQAHINGEGAPGAKAGTPKAAAGSSLGGTGLENGLSWSPSSAPTTPSGKGEGVPSLPFAQVRLGGSCPPGCLQVFSAHFMCGHRLSPVCTCMSAFSLSFVHRD